MKEFTEKAPKYEGLDKGMAIAKIGFAIASGKDPNAIVNIANGLSMGADMFIEDKKEKDAFDRQLKLSALQYGMGEISKERAQARADRRDFNDYIVNKPGTYFGREYEKEESIRLSMDQVLSLGPKAMQNLSSLEAYTERKEAIASAIENLRFPEGSMEMKDLRPELNAYDENLKAAKDSETAIVALNDALLELAGEPGEESIVTFKAAGKEIFRQVMEAFGKDVGDDYNKMPMFKRKLGVALNAIIPSLIGDTQSANSISDRDVGFIVTAFLDAGLLDQEGEGFRLAGGATNFLGKNEDSIAFGLSQALIKIQDAQRSDLQKMLRFEEKLGGLGIKDTKLTAGDYLSRQIAERKLISGTPGTGVGGSSLLYLWDPDKKSITLRQ